MRINPNNADAERLLENATGRNPVGGPPRVSTGSRPAR